MERVLDVPASLSNLGPGFDCLGLALSTRNRFAFRLEAASGAGEADASDLVVATAARAAERFGRPLQGRLVVRQDESIPRARGLGASATARVAGFLAWSAFAGVDVPTGEAIAFLAAEEGHPDNVVPALLGGLTIATLEGGSVRYVRLDPPPGLSVALAIPDRVLLTSQARSVLPDVVDRADAVFNVSRVSFLLAALLAGRSEVLALGAEDRLHQPHRKSLIGPVDEVFAAAREAGAASAFVSGSGSTLAAFVADPTVDPAAVAGAMAAVFQAAGIACEARTATPSPAGALGA